MDFKEGSKSHRDGQIAREVLVEVVGRMQHALVGNHPQHVDSVAAPEAPHTCTPLALGFRK